MERDGKSMAGIQDEDLIHCLWDVNHKMRALHEGKASQSRILIILNEKGSMTQRAMTEHLQIKPGSASEILSKLEKRGLIARRENEEDRRTADLILTEKGKAVALEAVEMRRRLYEEMLGCLSEEEKRTLIGLLCTLQSSWVERFPVLRDKAMDDVEIHP